MELLGTFSFNWVVVLRIIQFYLAGAIFVFNIELGN